MCFTPSQTIADRYLTGCVKQNAKDRRQEPETEPVNDKEYYRKVKISRNDHARAYIDKLKHTNKGFHFFVSERRIFEGQPIIRAILTHPETIVIQHNISDTTPRKRKYLEQLLQDLRRQYPEAKEVVGIEEEYYDKILASTGRVKSFPNGKTIITFGNNDEVVYEVENITYDSENKPIYKLKRSELGDEIIKLYLEDSDCCTDSDCCVASFHRFEKAFKRSKEQSLQEYLNSINYYLGRANFRALWYTSYKDFNWRKISAEYAGKGGAGAVESAGLGKSFDTRQIFAGELKPGAVVQYWDEAWHYERLKNGQWNLFTDEYGNKPTGHSFIFLGYKYNDNGNIIGLYQWTYKTGGFADVSHLSASVYWGTNYEN